MTGKQRKKAERARQAVGVLAAAARPVVLSTTLTSPLPEGEGLRTNSGPLTGGEGALSTTLTRPLPEGEGTGLALGRDCTDEDLHKWILENVGLNIPTKAVCEGHDAPFEYVKAAFREQGDLVVWAPRGGGKTTMAALVTMLDALCKPGCEIRILGGSEQQTMAMWEHLWPMLMKCGGEGMVERVRERGGEVWLKNGSSVRILQQSQGSVRGQRVQKLRCDEAELFRPGIWQAAQLITRSRTAEEAERLTNIKGTMLIKGTVEALSTMHKQYGLMYNIIDGAKEDGRRVIRWCILDVLEKCEGRECEGCVLKEECGGKLKGANGFVRIDDAIRMKHRAGKEMWETEMLCQRPSRGDAVFGNFKRETHVRDGVTLSPLGSRDPRKTLAIDFGFRNPFVCLWVLEDREGYVYVLDEYVKRFTTLGEHIREIKKRHPGYGFREVVCDPAGNTANSQTSLADVDVLRGAGFQVRTRGTTILGGLEAIQAALLPAMWGPTLRIDSRCKELIKSMEQYHYDARNRSEWPDKDGENDHCVDALRYYYVNRGGGVTGATRY